MPPHTHTTLSLGKFVFDIEDRMDHIPVPGEKLTAKSQVIVPGGGAVKAAICIAEFGMQSHLHTTVGTDYFGGATEQMLVDRKVRVIPRYVTMSSFNTVFTEVGDRAIARAPKREYVGDDFPKLEPDGYDALLLDGYQEDAALHHAQTFFAAGKLVLLDCNPRPNTDELLPFTGAAVAGESYMEGNRDFTQPCDVLAYFGKKGCPVRAITFSERGLWFCEGDNPPQHMEAIHVDNWQKRNSNGLGDAFHGALACSYALWRDKGWEYHFRFATCYAALMLEKSDHHRFYPTIENVLALMHSRPELVRAARTS